MHSRVFSLLVSLLAILTRDASARGQFKAPAPAYIVRPDPDGYRNWLPIDPEHGTFSDRNLSVTPWKPQIPHHRPNYSRPIVCDVGCSGSQAEFWLATFAGARQGFSPFLADGQDYKVFRNVNDYGAAGDGETDDTDAFNMAISDQSRTAGGKGAGGTTGQPALIYVPPGTYKISSTVQLFVDTQIIGDAINPPTLKASSATKANTVLVGGYDDGQPSTTNFYIGIRNIIIDTTEAPAHETIYALNWAVSQACNIVNVNFTMPQDSNHIGLEMDGGSSGGGSALFMGDLSFEGGLIGILFNNQQYAIKNVKFRNMNTAIAIQHAFVVTLQGIDCEAVGICVDVGELDVSGSVSLIDSSCHLCGIVVNGTSSILLENIAVVNSGSTLTVNGSTLGLGDLTEKTYVRGHVYYKASSGQGIDSNGSFLPYTQRGSLAASDGRYFTKSQPQYRDLPVSAFASVKDAGAKGDGVSDDTAAIQQALLANADCKVTYFPHGVYLVMDTIYVPPGSRIVGEVWSTITASGKHFADDSDPQPMIQVGNPGETGLVEFTDMLFTVADVLPGAILVKVNMKGQNQGDVSFHNCHYRIGGAADSRTETACQTESDPCKAAFLVLYLGQTSGSYVENAWLWAADHDLDGAYNQQIGTGRGLLVESTQPTWLVGIGSEHHTLYAVQLANACTVFSSLMQVETPYWQPSPRAPAPWTPNATWNDPDFASCAAANVSQCYMQWALRIVGSDTRALHLYGQGFWVFFNGPNYGACTGPEGSCQLNAVDVETEVRVGDDVELYQVSTKGMLNMIVQDGSGGQVVVARQDENIGSWGGVIAAFVGFR